jgi:hypothetical protein
MGYLVERPEILFMYKPSDRFLAYDAFRIIDGRVVATIDRDSWDAPACERLGLDWSTALLLEGMPLVTVGGVKLGSIDSVEYDERSGKPLAFLMTDGLAAKALIGSANIPVELLVRYQDGGLIVKDEAMDIATQGGLAERAGEQAAIAAENIKEGTAKVARAAGEVTAKASKAAGKLAAKAGKAASDATVEGSKAVGRMSRSAGKSAGKAVDKGSRALGKQIHKTTTMFSDFKEAYQLEAGSGSAPKKPESQKSAPKKPEKPAAGAIKKQSKPTGAAPKTVKKSKPTGVAPSKSTGITPKTAKKKPVGTAPKTVKKSKPAGVAPKAAKKKPTASSPQKNTD